MLDATVGGANANSYLDVSWADEYFSNRLYSDNWTSLESNDMKERALMTATSIAEAEIEWAIYSITNSSQALTWPALTSVRDNLGRSIPGSFIPVQVKKAICEIAYLELSEDRRAENDLSGFSSVKVGPLSLSVDKRDRKSVIPDIVWSILGELGNPRTLSASSGWVTLGRG